MMSVDAALSPYLWLVVVGSIAAFTFGFGTGANDVGNAFATSVGAETLTLRQAVLLAGAFEFTGALVLGRTSVSTISGGIADINAFTREPEIFAYGMVCAMVTSGVWQIVASYYELNVSATHSIIGAIIGFALVYSGKDAVKWNTPDPNSFPPYKGVVPIVVTWFVGPIFTAASSALTFWFVRTFVLRTANPVQRSYIFLPVAVTGTVYVCTFYVLTKGARKTLQEEHKDNWSTKQCNLVALYVALGLGLAVMTTILIYRHMQGKTEEMEDEDQTYVVGAHIRSAMMKHAHNTPKAQLAGSEVQSSEDDQKESYKGAFHTSLRAITQAMTHGVNVDVHAVVQQDVQLYAIHANADVFHPHAEQAFRYLQVFSAICVMFAHGASEVGYMAGPLAAIWQIYNTGKLTGSVNAPVWTVVIAAAGLVVGMATYGYQMVRAMGVRLAKISPSRGFCAELATAMVIMVCSQAMVPTSSSQCITGGIIGVGMMEGRMGVNWKFLGKQFASWVATVPLVSISTALLFAQGVYTPGKVEGKAQMFYEDNVAATASIMFDNYRHVLDSYQQASLDGAVPQLAPAVLADWSQRLIALSGNVTELASSKQQTVDPAVLWGYLNTALALYRADSVLTVGQNRIFPGAFQCNSNVTADIDKDKRVPCPAPGYPVQPEEVLGPWGTNGYRKT